MLTCIEIMEPLVSGSMTGEEERKENRNEGKVEEEEENDRK